MHAPPQFPPVPVSGDAPVANRVPPVLPVPWRPQPQPPQEADLRNLLHALRRRWPIFLGVAALVSSLIWWRATQIVPVYQGRFQILVESVANEPQLPQLLGQTGDTSAWRGDRLDYDTQIQVLLSPEILDPILTRLQTRYPNLTYDTLIKGLSVTRLQNTKILEVRFRGPDATQIKFVLDQLAQGYLDYSLQTRRTSLSQGIQFVEEQIPLMQARVNRLQATLQDLRQRYSFTSLDTKAQELESQLSALESQRLNTLLQLQGTQQRLNTINNKAGATAVLRQDALYQSLVEQVRQVDAQIAQELARSQPDSPALLTLQRQRENLLPLLRQEAERALSGTLATTSSDLQALQAQQQTLAQVESQLRQQLAQLPALSRLSADLERELTLATGGLTRLLEARERLLLDAAQQEIPWQLLSIAEVPSRPIEPNIPRQLLLGVIAGLLAGSAAVFLAEKLDESLQSVEEVKELTQAPLLGVIPYTSRLGGMRQVILPEDWPSPEPASDEVSRRYRDYKGVPFMEAFRSLWTVLRLLNNLTPMRSLVISSAAPAEGKSTIALNLSHAAAAMGKRVLLVDADLRRPQLHRALGLSNQEGLSTLLLGDRAPADLIQMAPREDNFFILTAGPSPHDPSRLLASHRMRAIMGELETQFDIIIYDTPPLLGFSDAQLLAPATGGVALVVGLGKTKRSAVKRVVDYLQTAQIPLLGVIANGVQRIVTGYSYNGYYYRYYHQDAPKPKVPVSTVEEG
ncbi:polysaccharide biosynthesis tyrosine autokinase [Trichothermofontia sichuanensis B231]|uniref:GumC family protein n=1 Tax=Trichothermofontia sichuanensis TaxID=3045816 RepID=UPI0022479095|nr:polysaccharide biosynthesis tyrosine autokinase [Trichothermofontia sichuanensis]UZQ55469.1 polysaccharide biosynthesis tyrosine autokinase [Trichothermofontia sichuanensis B231]